jgi:outer membrane protein
LRANNLYDPNTFVSITGPELRSNLVPHPQFRAGLFGQYVSSRNNIDDNRVEDLNNTDSSVLVGGTVGWDFFPEPTIGLTTALDARADVANGNGWLVTPRVTYNNALPGNALSFTAEASTTWASDDYMEEYFSVQSGPARRTGLDRYNADADFKDFAIKGTVSYAFTERWSTTLAGQYKRMLGDAKDSPVVDDRGDENQFITALTVNFKF